jgi:CTP synthase (UTP-ammonia lyase)
MRKKKSIKYIFVVPRLISILTNPIPSSSIPYLLKNPRLKITILKLDPYLNLDPCTINPYQHTQLFVLDH